MFILTALIMFLIGTLFTLYQAFGSWCVGNRATSNSKSMMEWARTHEDEWLPYTDLVVREGNTLHYYPKDSFNKNNYKSGCLVDYGVNASGTEYGLVCRGNIVFGYEQFITAKAKAYRLLYMCDEKLISLGVEHVLSRDGVRLDTVYKRINKEEYYTYFRDRNKRDHFIKVTKNIDGKFEED